MADLAPSRPHDIAGIYTGHHRWLLGWLRRRTDNAELAADLAQDTFVRMMVSRRDFIVDEVRTLLATIARGLMIDHFRRCALEAAFLASVFFFFVDQIIGFGMQWILKIANAG